jgi:superfamily I DNA/RNA helicase
VFEEPLEGCVQWWLDHLHGKKRKQADYPARVALRRGVKALVDTPRIIIGTGHSVKGGEADVVFIFPDLSASGMRQWEGSRKDRDAVIRLGYVMITRARETLVICEPSGAHHMPLAGFAARAVREP